MACQLACHEPMFEDNLTALNVFWLDRAKTGERRSCEAIAFRRLPFSSSVYGASLDCECDEAARKAQQELRPPGT